MKKLLPILFIGVVIAGAYFIGTQLIGSGKVLLKPAEKAQYHYKLAEEIYYDDKNNAESALDHLERALESQPKNKKVNLLIGKIYSEMPGQGDLAIGFFETAMENSDLRKEDVETFFIIAKFYISNEPAKKKYGFKECYKLALENYRNILTIEKDNHKAMLGAGLCLSKLGYHSKSRVILEQLLKKEPEYKIKEAAEKIYKNIKDLNDEDS